MKGAASEATRGDRSPARPGRFVRWGFVLGALFDAALSAVLHPVAREGGGAAWGLALAYAAAHVVAIGFVLGALADAGSRWFPERRGAPAVLAFTVAVAAGFGVFVEDFSVFPLWLRVVLIVAAAAPIGLLVLLRPRVRRSRWLSGVAMGAALSAAAANQLALDDSYPGLHLAGHVFTGLLASIALEGLGAPVPRAEGKWALALDAALAAGVAASIAVWPPNAILVALTRLPTAGLLPFLSMAHDDDGGGRLAVSERAQRAWFTLRDGLPPVPPTEPRVFAPKPVVILLTIDALRADVVLADAADAADAAKATRNLRLLAARGVSFTMARSTASSTSPALASMFTGKYYSSLHWEVMPQKRKMKYFLPRETAVRFPELLRAAGVKTAHVDTASGFLPEFGIVRGLDTIDGMVSGSEKVLSKIAQWLGGIGDSPGLVWAHLPEPHHPYVRGDAKAEPYVRYLAEVAEVDKQLGVLVRAIDSHGLRDRAYVVVTADHGEAFGEHGTSYHASTVYEEMVRVPMIIVGPGIGPRTSDEPVSLIDVGPTVLDLFGQDTPGHMMGQSLVPLLLGRNVELRRPMILDTGRRKQALIGRDGLKAIRNIRQKTTELYDLEADPGELVNLVETRSVEARERLGALKAFFAVHELRREGYSIPYRE